MARKESGGKSVKRTVPAAVLKSGTMLRIKRPGNITSAPDCPNAPPNIPATRPKISVNKANKW